TRMFKVGLVSPDELELVLTFVSQGSTVPEEVTDNERLTFRGYEVSANAVAELDPRRFRDDDGWRERYITGLGEHSNPASRPVCRGRGEVEVASRVSFDEEGSRARTAWPMIDRFIDARAPALSCSRMPDTSRQGYYRYQSLPTAATGTTGADRWG